MAGSSSERSIVSLVASVATVGVITYIGAKMARKASQKLSRKCAASPFEYQIALHRPSRGGRAYDNECILVKIPKSADFAVLASAVAKAMALSVADAEGIQLLPVHRRREGAIVGPKLSTEGGVASFEGLLAQRPADALQVVELVCLLAGEVMPLAPPVSPAQFPTPGTALPFLGHMYLGFGKESIVLFNITNSIFPPRAACYPYAATVRMASGALAEIGSFPDETVFHMDATSYITFTADAAVVEELLARHSEFPKLWNRKPQIKVSDFTGNGLFTSSETSEDWQTAHNLLPRGFNQIRIKSFAPRIMDKTRAFIQEWSAFPAGHTVQDVNHWLTAMTADAVVACSMGLDMKNVERLGKGAPPHPFIDNFRFGLGYAMGTINARNQYGLKRLVPGFQANAKLAAKYEECKKELSEIVEQMVEQTRAGTLGGQHSIIRSMLEDKASNGKYVRYNVICGHIINLMIAGHETTAATLGFTLQLLAEHPKYEERAYEEVKRVLRGKTEPEVDDVPKLQFVEQCFREALRLYSPVGQLSRDVAYDTLLQGRSVFQGERIVVVTRALHTNPEYWGGEFGDPLSYNPDRFSPEAVQARHPNAYHPWGFGTRACIGSQFALFEAKTFLASMLIHFKLVPVPGYRLRASTDAGGAAPSADRLALIVYPRPGGPLFACDGSMLRLASLAPVKEVQERVHSAEETVSSVPPVLQAELGQPLYVLYGSNAGSSQEFASQAASLARKGGFNVTLMSLDQGVNENVMVPDGRLIVVVTSTYNGNPPDNGVRFKAWMQEQSERSLVGLRFAVFGVGNSQWKTYQQFPREVTSALEHSGAKRVHELGACDVDSPSFQSDFEEWLSTLARAVGSTDMVAAYGELDEDDASGADEFIVVEDTSKIVGDILCDSNIAVSYVVLARDVAAKELGVERLHAPSLLKILDDSRELCQKPGSRSVRHITLQLPLGKTYRAGDHLEIIPPNHPDVVHAALTALDLDPNTPVLWDASRGGPNSDRSARGCGVVVSKQMRPVYVTANLVLQWIPDLAAVPNRKVFARLSKHAHDEQTKTFLQSLASNADIYKEEVSGPHLALVEVLQRFQGRWSLSIGDFMAIAKPIMPRYYSVSSSPDGVEDPRVVTISVARVEFTTGTGRLHQGLASTFLGDARAGSLVLGCVRQLASNFSLPQDTMAPVIMVGPGTGIAPMMGFLQERRHLLRLGKKLGPAILFFGCRRSDEDYLYREELAIFLRCGCLSELHCAFSREGPQKVYVQDVIYEKREQVWKLLEHPSSRVLLCGDARSMAPDVRKTFARVVEACGGKSQTGALNMIAAMVEGGRYIEDVWA